MHPENGLWWHYCRIRYPRYFSGVKVVEFGSFNINGSVRQFFNDCDYTGLDWRPGPCVDVTALAHEFKTDKKYDTVISASMLEHDPFLDQSVKRMVDVMDDNGILLLSFGCCALIREHCLAEAPDGKYHPVKGSYIRDLLTKYEIYIEEFRYTHKWMNYRNIEQIQAAGEIVVLGFKNPKNSNGNQHIEEMIGGDV